MSRLWQWFARLEKAAAYQKSDDCHILASFAPRVSEAALHDPDASVGSLSGVSEILTAIEKRIAVNDRERHLPPLRNAISCRKTF